MPTLSSRPNPHSLCRTLTWLVGFVASLGLLSYAVASTTAWLGYLLQGLAGVLVLLGGWIGGRWLYLHPRLMISERGLTRHWPWRTRFIHWREVLRIEENAQREGGWLMGRETGYRLTYGAERQCFLSLRYQTRHGAIQRWLAQIARQLPLHDVASVAGLPTDPEVRRQPRPPRPALRLPKTYDGPIWRSENAFSFVLVAGLALFFLVKSQGEGPPNLVWLGGLMGLTLAGLCYWDFHRITLHPEEISFRKRLWFRRDVSIALKEIEQVRIERQIRQPRSMVLALASGRKRRFVAGQLRTATWRELAYALAELRIHIHLGQDCTDLFDE